MACIWRIHGSKPYIWSLVYNTSVFCFSHFHLEGVGGWSEPNETNFIWKKLSHFETIPKSFYLLSSNVWFSDVPDKDKEIDTATIYKMYVILYFIKWRNEKKIEKCKVLFTQYEFRDNFFAFFILMNSHGNEANVYEI